MNPKLLAQNISTCPIVPKHYRAQILAALGGTVELGELTSKQGGTTVNGLLWENNQPADPLNLEELHHYCQRQDIFYTLFPGIDNPQRIHAFVQDRFHKYKRTVGNTFAGTLAAALILLRNSNGN